MGTIPFFDTPVPKNIKMITASCHAIDRNKQDKRIFEFDKRGNIIKWAWFDSNGYPFDIIIYQYDKADKLIKETHFWNQELSSTYHLKYDRQDRLVKKITYDDKGKFWETTLYHNDNNGNLIQKSNYGRQGQFQHMSLYRYDKENKLIERIDYLDDGEIEDWNEYEYNDKGQMIIWDGYCESDQEKPDRTIYKYDKRGNVVEEAETTVYIDRTYRRIFKYSPNGRLIKEVSYQIDRKKGRSIKRQYSETAFEYAFYGRSK